MIKEAIVDSGIWIASRAENSESKKASNILEAFSDLKISKIYITDYILLESVNFLLRKKYFDVALEIYDYLTKTDRINIIYVNENLSIRIKELFEKYKTLSLTDCSIIALAENSGIKTVFSFDSGFEKIKSISRKESF
jgi:predicted nucleic acid-binding protein